MKAKSADLLLDGNIPDLGLPFSINHSLFGQVDDKF